MEYRILGKTNLRVSALSYGASALGSMYRSIDETEGMRTVHTALDNGINYIDVSPFYGLTKAETVLGKALKDIPRDRYYLATKAGRNGWEEFDFSEKGIIRSAEASMQRLGVDYFDVLQLHDIEYFGRRYLKQALEEAIPTLQKLKQQGKIRFFGITAYPIEVFEQVLSQVEVDTILCHNHYTLGDTLLLELMPLIKEKNVGLIGASPLGSGLLTERGAPDWHPANENDRTTVKQAVNFCKERGTSLEKLAIQFATANKEIPTTLVSTASSMSLKHNIDWLEEPFDVSLAQQVQEILQPIMNKDWKYAD
jgi:aryl-alcohol dehydrogenase-like predicted oxidoreductase